MLLKDDNIIKNLIENNKFKLPEETVCGVLCQGYNFEELTKNMNKPFDAVLVSLLQTTAKDTAPEIKDCFSVLSYGNNILYLINVDANNSDLQSIVSFAASKTTLTFYERLYAFIYEYQETAMNTLQDEELEIAQHRIETLCELLDENPIFKGTAFYIPSSLEISIIEEVSNIAQEISKQSLLDCGCPEEELEEEWKDMPTTVKYGFGLEKNIAGAWIDMYLEKLGEENGIKFNK